MKYTLKILLLTSFFLNLSAGLFGPLYAAFVEQIGGSLLITGSSYAMFAIVSGVMVFILGKWEDGIKHQEKLLVLSRFLTVVGIAGYLLIQTPAHLFIVQSIIGLSYAVGSPAYSSLYSKNLTKGKFASQWGTWESMSLITAGISAIIGGYIAGEFGFRTLFAIMLILSIIAFITSLLLIKKRKKER